MFFTVKILSVRFLPIHPVHMRWLWVNAEKLHNPRTILQYWNVRKFNFALLKRYCKHRWQKTFFSQIQRDFLRYTMYACAHCYIELWSGKHLRETKFIKHLKNLSQPKKRNGRWQVYATLGASFSLVTTFRERIEIILCGSGQLLPVQNCRAGHFRYIWIFSLIKNYFSAFFIKFEPISAPVLFKKPTPSQINLIKKAKNNFLLLKKLKHTESAQLCSKGQRGL